MRGRRRLPPRGAGYRPEPSNHTERPKPPPGPGSVSKAQPTIVVVHVQEHPLDRDVQAIQQVLATDPCRILGHRAAYLRAGGAACGTCGTPL